MSLGLGLRLGLNSGSVGISLPPFFDDLGIYLNSELGISGTGDDLEWEDQKSGLVASKDASYAVASYDSINQTIDTDRATNARLVIPSSSGLYPATGSLYVLANADSSSTGAIKCFFATKGPAGANDGLYFGLADSGSFLDTTIIQCGNGTQINTTTRASNGVAIQDEYTIYSARLGVEGGANNDVIVNVEATKVTELDVASPPLGTSNSANITIGAITGSGNGITAKFKCILWYPNVKHTDEQEVEVRNWISNRFRIDSELSLPLQNQITVTTSDDLATVDAGVGDQTSFATRLVPETGVHDVVAYFNSLNILVTGEGVSSTTVQMLQPDSTSASDITNRSTFECRKSCVIENLTATCQNGRYVFHPEENTGQENKIFIQNVTATHLGNPSGNNTWPTVSQNAVGSGTRSGGFISLKDSTFNAPERAISTHNNKGFTAPSTYLVDNCTLNSTNANPTQLQLLQSQVIVGSGIAEQDVFRVTNCTTTGGFFRHSFQSSGYDLTPDKAKYNTDYLNEILGTDVWYEGNDPSSSLRFRQEAFRVDSNSTSDTDSVLLIDSDGLFGNSLTGGVISVALGSGLSSYAHGTFDVNNFYDADNALGPRLGDCSVINKSFTVTQGDTSETVTLDIDYTALSNAAVLSDINGKLSSFTASTYNFMSDYFPTIDDITLTATNNGAESVGVGYGVKMLANDSFRIAEQSDSTDIAVAVDEIPVGGSGRVVYRNRISFYQLFEAIAGQPADNTEIGIGSTNGQWVTSPTNATLRADGTVGYEFIAGYTPT